MAGVGDVSATVDAGEVSERGIDEAVDGVTGISDEEI